MSNYSRHLDPNLFPEIPENKKIVYSTEDNISSERIVELVNAFDKKKLGEIIKK